MVAIVQGSVRQSIDPCNVWRLVDYGRPLTGFQSPYHWLTTCPSLQVVSSAPSGGDDFAGRASHPSPFQRELESATRPVNKLNQRPPSHLSTRRYGNGRTTTRSSWSKPLDSVHRNAGRCVLYPPATGIQAKISWGHQLDIFVSRKAQFWLPFI